MYQRSAMKRIVPVLILLLPLLATGQSFQDRYRTEVFSDFDETENVLFSEDVPQPTPGGGFYEWLTGLPLNADDTETTPVDLYMDILEPAGDTIEERPAVIICFGGGFLTGSRDHWSIRLLAEHLARCGFVTATIDYRLGFNVFDSDLAQRSVYRAIQDSRAAVKFLRANAGVFRIDTNQVYLGGHSAGAFMALHNLYLDKEIERPVSTFEWVQNGQVIPDLGPLDTTGVASGVSGHANCAFSLAGALGFLSFIEDSLDNRSALFHSEDDETVPYDTGEPFGNISGFIVGSDLPDVYGSLPIDMRAAAVSLADTFHSYTSRGHGVHEAPGDTSLYTDIIPRIGDWFYEQRLKPESHPLLGRAHVCDNDLTQSYSIENGDALYFDWQVTGGTFTSQCDTCNEAEVLWSAQAIEHSIAVTPYNAFESRGDTQTVNVEIVAGDTAIWTGGSGEWFDGTNWSTGRSPLPCDEVIVTSNENPLQISIPPGSEVHILKLTTSGMVDFTIGEDAVLQVEQ